MPVKQVDHLKLPLIEVQWTTKILFLEETTGPKWEKIDIAERARLARMAISTSYRGHLLEVVFVGIAIKYSPMDQNAFRKMETELQ